MDGTPFNRQLVSQFRTEDGKAFNVGSATVLLVFDRVSKRVVGWHVYLGSESWKEGYRLALLCAMTSKKERLEWLGITDRNPWRDDENIRPARIYIDGGAAASTLGAEALARMSMGFEVAPPSTPYWKPTVEGGLGARQAEQSHLGGGYERTNDAVEKDQRRRAKLHADDDVMGFEKQLVLDIIAYNERIQEELHTPAEMKRRGVLPSPDNVFRLGLELTGGLSRRLLAPSEVWRRLAEHKPNVQVTLNGISLHGSRYSSEALETYWRIGKKGLKIDVFYDPLRLGSVHWITPDGALDELKRRDDGDEAYGTASAVEIEDYRLRVKAIAQLQTKEKQRKTKLTARQEGIARDAALHGRKLHRKSATTYQEEMRKRNAEYQLVTRPYDQPSKFLPELAGEAPEVGGKKVVQESVEGQTAGRMVAVPNAVPDGGPSMGDTKEQETIPAPSKPARMTRRKAAPSSVLEAAPADDRTPAEQPKRVSALPQSPASSLFQQLVDDDRDA